MKKQKAITDISIYAIITLLCYLILNQGGYFAGGIISGAIITSILLYKAKIQIKPIEIAFFVFSLWYFFCSVKGGFDIRYAAKGAIPFVCLVFKFLLPKNKEDAQELCQNLVKVAFYLTILSICICIYSCITGMRIKRLTFPFRYANASGIFFSLMFILSRYAGFKNTQKMQYVFFSALALTQSVGAIGLAVIAEIILSRDKRKTLILLAVILVGAIVLRGRIYQSIGTFTERFLQMQDGFLCMFKNPIFGIGAGRWELYKNIYQTGIYDAKEIHGVLAQIGSASGIPGLIMTLVVLVWLIKTVRFNNKAFKAALIMLLVHSCMDFTLSFVANGFIAMILIACGETTEKQITEIKQPLKQILSTVLTICFVSGAVCVYSNQKIEGISIGKNYPKYIKVYNSNILAQKSTKSKQNYAAALFATGNKEQCLMVLDEIPILSIEMIMLKKACLDDWAEVIKYIKQQPYNTILYEVMRNNCDDEKLQSEAEQLLDNSLNSMSPLGKILYDFLGEEI